MTPDEIAKIKKEHDFYTAAQIETIIAKHLKEFGVEGNIPREHKYWVIKNVLRAKRNG